MPEVEDTAIVSPVIGILGAKGGSGTTTIAINLAAALSQMLGTITLIDANLQQPDIAITLGREPRYTVLDLLLQMPEINQEVFEACCVSAHPSMRLLSPPLAGVAALTVSLSQLADCLDSIRSLSQGWIVDLPKHLDRHLVCLLDRCDVTVLVFEASLTGVAAARRWLNIFEDLDYPKERTICLVNRSGSAPSAIEKQLDHYFGGLGVCKIPNAYRLAQGCVAQGQTAVLKYPNERYSKAIIKLARYLKQHLGSIYAGSGLTNNRADDISPVLVSH